MAMVVTLDITPLTQVQHSFQPNCELWETTHPVFGYIPCVRTLHSLDGGEELTVNYNYMLDDCPQWSRVPGTLQNMNSIFWKSSRRTLQLNIWPKLGPILSIFSATSPIQDCSFLNINMFKRINSIFHKDEEVILKDSVKELRLVTRSFMNNSYFGVIFESFLVLRMTAY